MNVRIKLTVLSSFFWPVKKVCSSTAMLARKDLFPALQNNFSIFGPLSLTVGPEVEDPVAFSTKVYQRYLGNLTIDRDHIEEITKVNTVQFSGQFLKYANANLVKVGVDLAYLFSIYILSRFLLPLMLNLEFDYPFQFSKRTIYIHTSIHL